MKKRILFISNNFWPENFRSYDAVNLINKISNVSVLTGYPTYPEKEYFKNFDFKSDNSKLFKIYRVPTTKRTYSKFSILLNYLSFILNGIIIGTFKLKKIKFDYIICFASSPIFQSLLTIWFAKIKKCKSIIWVQDIWPETLIEINYINNKNVINIIKSAVNILYKRHDLILTQSISYKNNLFNIFPQVSYLPNPVDKFNEISFINNIFEKKEKEKVKYITYAGNIGLAQNFNLILRVSQFYRNNHFVKFLIIGDGAKFYNVKKMIENQKLKNVTLLKSMPRSKISYVLKNSEVLFITLNDGFISKNVIPSKFQTYTSFSKPILAQVGGDVKDLIKRYKCGFIVNDLNSLKKAIDAIIRYSKDDLINMGNNSKKLFDNEFSDQIFIDKFKKIINEI